MRRSFEVTFQPDGLSVHVLEGTSILEAAGEAGIVIDTPCGGKGTCGKCLVRVLEGAPSPADEDTKVFTKDALESGFRLACQSKVTSDIVVTVPSKSRFFEQKILAEGDGDAPVELCLEKRCVTVPQPSLEDIRSDEERVIETLDVKSLPLQAVRELPRVLREGDHLVTAILDCGQPIGLEPGDTREKLFGAAFDIGTTTVVGVLVNLKTGEKLSVASRTNPQVVHGDDVISRIEYSSEKGGLENLRQDIVECLNRIISELTKDQEVKPSDIYEVTVACNTTMSHLFLGIDPTYIAQAPYPAGIRRPVKTQALDAGLIINSNGLVHVLPNIAGFVGSDTVSVVLATGMSESDSVKLAVDIGTNGEVVLGSRKKLLCCSTAAGPAFEGARISQGMRAMPGAIEKVMISDDVSVNTIGGEPPKGICGSGLIDAVAELLKAGIVDSSGKLLPQKEVPEGVPDDVKNRIVKEGEELGFAITTDDEGGKVVLTQRDIRQVQLAKGAVFAGIEILKKELGVKDKDISEVLLAGAFANFVRRSNAKRIGLLPDIPSEKIRFVGNAALAGARMALISRSCRNHAEKISQAVQYVELAGRSDFQDCFSDAMMFPES